MIDNYTLNNFEQLSSVKQACDASVTLKSKSTAGKINPALDPVKKNTSVYQIPLKKPTNPAYTAATYKHHNFLKSEYELARAQVASDKRVKNTASLVQCNDDRNNNTTLKVASSVCRPGVVTIGSAGLKKSGAGDRNVLPEITRAKILTSAAQSADLQKRRARSTCETEGNIKTITTTKTATAAVSTKPSSAAAGNKLHINNNMQGQQQCLNLQDDDIKYIDSDDLVTAFELKMDFQQQRCCQPQPQHRAKTRPKSTIICSVNQQAPVFQKVNKYTTGSSLSELNSASPEQHRELNSGGSGNGIGIDSISIKASIEKFNNLSKQKRIPLPFTTPTLRSQCKGSGSGSTSNLQHNRYSSDFSDAYNARLQSSVVSGGSLTRSSTRNYDASSVANKVVTNIYAGTATSSTSSVAVKTRIHYANSQSSAATTVARGSGNCNKSTESSPTHVSAAPSPALHRVLPRTTDHRNSNGNSSAVNTVAVNVSEPRGNSRGSECNDNKVLYNSCDSDTDDSVSVPAITSFLFPSPVSAVLVTGNI